MAENVDFEQLPDDLETLENRINASIEEFCMIHDIANLRKESQSVFVACLTFVYRRVFKPQKAVFTNRKSVIDYTANADLLLGVVDYYIYLCELNEKAVSMFDFCKLIGIDYSTIREWSVSLSSDDKLSQKKSSIRKRLIEEREQSLIHKLEDGKNQAVSYIAVLNRQYGWSLPGVSREEAKPALTRDDLLQGLDALPAKPVLSVKQDDLDGEN